MSAIIVGAGSGQRMEGPVLKQFIPVHSRPLLAHTIQKFQDCEEVDDVVIVVPRGNVAYCQSEIVDRFGFDKVVSCIEGGRERQDSVYSGLKVVRGEIVCVHDAVRPVVPTELLSECVESARSHGAAITAVPVRDTIKRVEGDRVIATLNRAELWEVQTPQAFSRELLVHAFEEALKDGFEGTDESSLVERLGLNVHVVMGSYCNVKVTSFEDLKVVEGLMAKGP
ncbi:MAG: 2-C-methyl-D-erythritol 4-phosphate cytidylyltransferase [bacterium]